MNIVVTGCAGFIGARVSELLINEGHKVFGIDSINDAYDTRLKDWRLKLLSGHDSFIFSKIDISDLKKIGDFFEDILNDSKNSISAIVNLAARAGVRSSIENPRQYYSTNVTGALNLLELSRIYNIKKFVQASTSSVYGNNKRPFTEVQNTDCPLSPYASSKKAAENLCYTYHRLYGIDITVLRYFTVYGPAGRPDMSPFRFIKWVAEDEEVIIYGDGSQERDFTYVDDIAGGTILGLTELGYEIINLGSEKPFAINKFLSLIQDKLGKVANVLHKSIHPADVTATCADISKAKRILNWNPKFNLDEGLDESINWYLRNRELAKDVSCFS